jgi:hypothetical protein
VGQDDQDEQHAVRDGGDDEEVGGHHLRGMIRQKRPPTRPDPSLVSGVMSAKGRGVGDAGQDFGLKGRSGPERRAERLQ